MELGVRGKSKILPMGLVPGVTEKIALEHPMASAQLVVAAQAV